VSLISEPSSAGRRLRRGPHELSRGRVAEIQRARILAAALEAVEEIGYARLTVSQVISRAKVSRKTFYDLFSDCEDCFLAAFEKGLAEAMLLAREAYEREPGWREGIRSALTRLLVLGDEQPGLARMLLVEVPPCGEGVLARRARALDELARVIDGGRSVSNTAHEPPQLTVEVIVGGVLGVIHTRLLQPDGEPLTDLLGPLMSMIVLPYLGARVAGRELSRPGPEIAQVRPPRRTASRSNPFEGLNMRLTYRTTRVLTAISERPGASNREVAKGSEIIDQGQISKLLARLAALDLINNRGEGQEGGAANAWHLTARGAQVEQAIRPR
jgi:AcrR family transcriptional regulator